MERKAFKNSYPKIKQPWHAHTTPTIITILISLEALMHYFSHQQLDMSDLNQHDEIVELPQSEWENHKVTNSEYD